MLNSLLAHLLPRSWLARLVPGLVLQWLVLLLLLSCEEWVVLRHQILLQKNDKIDLTLDRLQEKVPEKDSY